MSILIEEKDVDAVNLSLELERAVIAHRMENPRSLYITEDHWFPFWVRIRPDAGYIVFTTHTLFKRAAGRVQRLELCNSFNRNSFMITASADDERLLIDYALNFRDGVLRETFIRSCRQFSDIIKQNIHEFDPGQDILLPPGRQEKEDEENE